MDRRFPQRSPLARPIGNSAQIREEMRDDLYIIHILSGPMSGPEIGFYSGPNVLAPGTRVTVTWREESRLWEIGQVAEFREPAGEGDPDAPQIAVGPESMPFPLGSFSVDTGTPVYGNVGTALVGWAFDDTVDEVIRIAMPVPHNYDSGVTLRLWYRMATATTGTIQWRANVRVRGDGEDLDGFGSNFAVNEAVPGTLGLMSIVTLNPFQFYATGDLMRVTIERQATLSTAVGDAWLLGLDFVFTPNF